MGENLIAENPDSDSSTLVELIQSDSIRMRILEIVYDLALPDCLIAAGLVRNLVWDFLHGYKPTPLNDVDVIFYQDHDEKNNVARSVQSSLKKKHPQFAWQVKNQANIHKKNNDRKYLSSTDAMSFWPEKETAVGVYLNDEGEIQIVAPFGLVSLFEGKITHNPSRDVEIFKARISNKRWLSIWPDLSVVS